jgi:cytochrome P450
LTDREITMAEPVHFDPFEEDALADPGAAYGALRAACPFHHQPAQAGRPDYYVLSDHAEIKTDVLQGGPIWSFRFGNAMKDSISDVGFKTDGAFHAAFRMVVQRGLTPPAVKAWRPKIEAIVDELVEAMLAIPEGRGDFYSLFALPLPARMMCLMLGAPEADYLNYKRWSDTLQFLTFEDPEPGSYETVLREIYPHFTTLIEQRQAMLVAAGVDEPDLSHLGTVLPDDFMSRALVSRVEDRRLTHEEMLNICLAFLTGGQETTTNLIGHLLRRLLEAPERWEPLKANPALIDNAVEESLRFDPPVLAHFRTSLSETRLHDHDIPERAKLMFSICGANRDPAVFEDPDEFRIDRPLPEARQHLSFGSGVHLCLGAPVARLEAKIALERLIERLPNLRLLGVGGRVRTWMYWGHTGLDVAWN